MPERAAKTSPVAVGAYSPGDTIVSAKTAYRCLVGRAPAVEIREGKYIARFARLRSELDEVLKLRFEVFNLEMGEGLDASYRDGRDLDEYDEQCHHLIVVDTEDDDRIVGTYRMQTSEMATDGRGFYSDAEFQLSSLPLDILDNAVELGRACVAGDHRNTLVLFMLWKGLAAYMRHNVKRYLFGCCSLTSQDPAEGIRVMKSLELRAQLHPTLRAPVRPGLHCIADESAVTDEPVTLPKLFRIYLRYGAKVCSPPALDRQFKTIDFLVLFDVDQMDEFSRRIFFG